MSILFADPGGEYYFSSGMPGVNVWTTNSGMSLTSSAPAGRRTNFGITGSGASGMEKAIPGSPARIIAGLAFYLPASWLNATATTLISFKDAGTVQVDFRITSTGAIQITRNGTQLGSLSTNLLTNGSGWHYFEFDATIAPTTCGSAEVWVDGVSWVSVSGTNTRATSNSFAGTVRFLAGQSGQVASYLKDMYILDPSSGLYSARLGDTDVAVVYPNAAGVNQQFTNTGGASQTASVQDGRSGSGTRPDGDTTYISDTVSGHISDFAHDTLVAGAVFGVIHTSYARSDAGTTTFNQITLSAGTQRSTSQSIGATYSYLFDVMETDPHTGSAWTLANFNAATFGAGIP
jgi:hypothetical protein